MTTNPRSLAVHYDDDGLVKELICELCVEWTQFADLYRDKHGIIHDICRWCGTGEQRPHATIVLGREVRMMMGTPLGEVGAVATLSPAEQRRYLAEQPAARYVGHRTEDGRHFEPVFQIPLHDDELDDLEPAQVLELANDVDVYRGDAEEFHFTGLTFDMTQPAGQVPCHECGGTGWWGFLMYAERGPCIDCKGTGREWVGLW